MQGGQGGEEGEQAAKAVRAHSAAVTVLQRSSFRSDLILTMGAWTFAIWMDGSLRAPLCQSPAAPAMYSAGCWSPARPGWRTSVGLTTASEPMLVPMSCKHSMLSIHQIHRASRSALPWLLSACSPQHAASMCQMHGLVTHTGQQRCPLAAWSTLLGLSAEHLLHKAATDTRVAADF